MSDEFDVKRGVPQGGILSSILFNGYSEMLFKEALEIIEDDVIINVQLINKLRYADDTVLSQIVLTTYKNLLIKL